MRRAALVALACAVLASAGSVRADESVVTGRLRAGATEAVADVTIAAGWHVNSHTPADEFLIPTTLTLEPPAGVRAGDVEYPPSIDKVLPFSAGKAMRLYEGTLKLRAPLDGTAATGAPPLKGRLRYQACDESHCLPPRTLDLVAETEPAAPAASGGGAQVEGWIARWGWGATFLWVAVLGMALNLTPCVYPLISVTVAFFGGRSGDERGAVGRACCYVLGICTTFSLLGVTAALTGSLFGAALQRPEVLGGIALLMVALAASNFGLYQLRMPTGLMQVAGRAGEGAVGALFMGLTMGVVAAPCIGPIVVALLLFVGARQSAPLGFALFFTLGLGLGLPYVGLALAAGRLRRLPRGGAWLEWMERAFGFLLLAIALHFATPLLAPSWVRMGWALLLVTAGTVLGFLGPVAHPAVRWGRRSAGFAVVVLGIGALVVADAESPIAWTPYTDDALAHAAAAGRPALVDFEATWCLPCREMARTTFRDPAIVRAAGDLLMLKADVTGQDDRAAALMERWAVPGVPTYVLLDRAGREQRRLVGLVSTGDMLAAMHEVARGG
jgi:thiol:disulfide interchange protein DsbD